MSKRVYLRGLTVLLTLVYILAPASNYTLAQPSKQHDETVCFPESMQIEWVRHFPSNSALSPRRATGFYVDKTGNVYITGNSYNSSSGYDYTTIKYDADGIEKWNVQYNYSGHSDDEAADIVVDDSGNVYVTGSSRDMATGYDIVTIKYNANGNERWVAHYNSSSNNDDWAYAIALDVLGNVYVLGNAQGGTAIKYNPDGIEQWVHYGSVYDYFTAMVVDSSGDVYVTGMGKPDEATDLSFVTIKYSTDGVEQWVVYDTNKTVEIGEPVIAFDKLGNVYVAGKIGDGWGKKYKYLTVKYNSEGSELWAAYQTDHTGAGPFPVLAVDNMGNVFVSGMLDGNYSTIKYNTDGIEQWVSRDDPGYRPTAISVDSYGNVYTACLSPSQTTGCDFVTFKYSSDGVEQWVTRYSDGGDCSSETIGIATINDDNRTTIYIAGTSDTTTTIKYVKVLFPLSIQVNTKWNIVSVPLILAENRKSILFPTAISDAFSYENGTYMRVETLKQGKGYWMKFQVNDSIGFVGEPICQDTINVRAGWNLIGSSSYPVITNDIVAIPADIIKSQFYYYNSGYNTANTIVPGKGYWVKIQESGKLLLKTR